MIASLLSALFLMTPLAAAEAPAEAAGLADKAEEWRARVSKRLAEHKAKEPKASPDQEACRSCVAGQDLIDECYRVSVDEFSAAAPAPKECGGEEGACTVALSSLPFDKICAKRFQDPICRALLTRPSQRKALDKETRKLTDSCPKCCGALADWELRRKTLAQDLAALDAALEKRDLALLLGASARAERHQSCDWLCP